MSNPFDEVRGAVRVAKEQLRAADAISTDMAALLMGRLRCVENATILRKLKRELQDFNAVTGKWNE